MSLFGDYFPNRQDTTELRARLFVEEKVEPSPRVVLTVSGFAEGLLSRRIVPGSGRRAAAGHRRHRARSGRQGRAPRLAGRLPRGLRANRVGKARRDSADRRHQSPRCVAVLLRGAQRGAVADAAREGAPAPVRERQPRRHLPSGLQARALRSARRALVAVQSSGRCRAKIRWRAWPSAVRRRRLRCPIGRRRSPPAPRRAGRDSPPRAAGWTGASRCFAASSRSGCTPSRACRPQRPTVAVRLSPLHDDRRGLRGGSRQVGPARRGGGIRRRQLSVGGSAGRDRPFD